MSRPFDAKRPVLLLATQNRHKIREMREILSDLLCPPFGVHPDREKPNPLVSILDFPGVVIPDETGNTYAENAEAKARAAAEGTGLIALADDSGLEVDALSGAPGVHSARWLGEIPQTEKNRRIIEALNETAPNGRTARFHCAVAVCRPGQGREVGAMRVFEAALTGFISEKKSGGKGFGYDPIFLPEEAGRPGRRTLAEIPPEEKNRISHRARALRLAADFLSSLISGG
ncbi:MAG: RdgB/HAM1 family non-canonical purine NTP pyrophosphatase [Nitrospinota bacterium]|nr:RdgB/HAM1 family non-canonical purine NTP pyrophosphatase [Nitrospinota bacterium]HJM44059.1 RdgB/HAM1 family non-canonical purine NTP pyrophosphatase [Nitrospinota bacterium]